MGRLTAFLIGAAFATAGSTQQGGQQPFDKAGVCGRCHVISVVEWGISKHFRTSTGCAECHGASSGHIIDERNNVKPERMPKGAAIAALCAGCHAGRCPKSAQKDGCQGCHHFHALVDPKRPAAADPQPGGNTARGARFTALIEEGEKLVKGEQWEKAHGVYLQARRERPGDKGAQEKAALCARRLASHLRGFEIVQKQFDAASGLARKVRVAGVGIPMVLVPRGEFEMGSERFAGSRPVHTIRVGALYLGEHEVTQAEWKAVMGTNPSAHQGNGFPEADRMPVEQVSWDDAQNFVRKLNEKVEGGGFRLPTEAEWEYAARSPGTEAEPAGRPDKSPRVAGNGSANSLGVYDLLGNVWEWCSSLAAAYPYDQRDGRESPETTGLRVLRGGGFGDPADLLDPALRHTERPGRRLQWNGLRLARDVPAPAQASE